MRGGREENRNDRRNVVSVRRIVAFETMKKNRRIEVAPWQSVCDGTSLASLEAEYHGVDTIT